MNIYDISEKAGVSIATVSRVLNGNSKVSEKTRQKIMKVIEETGYQPNVFARGLGLNTMNTIGILCADSSDLVLANSVYQVEQELRNYHYDVLLSCTGYELENKAKSMNLLLSKRVDSLILVGSNFVEQDQEKNQYIINAAKEVPVIIINGYLDAPNVYCVLTDDEAIMEWITSHALGISKNLTYLYRSLSYSGRQKLLGVQNALKKEDQSVDAHLIQIKGDISAITEQLEEAWKDRPVPEIVLTSDDELAMGVFKFAYHRGMSIPDEIQIIGYNNSRISICCEPELTSIDNHINQLSVEAVKLLMQLLSGESIPTKTVIRGTMICRGTTTEAFNCKSESTD